MKYCKKCQVSVNNPVSRCPLCYATLSALDPGPEPLSYPDTSSDARHYNILLRILMFLSLSISVVCVTVNYFTHSGGWWSLIVVCNILYLWISIGTALRRHSRIGFTILVQGLSLAAMIMVFDRLLDTQVNWAFNFALPFLFFSATLAISIIVIVKRMNIRDFILYFLLTALLGFIPLALILLGMVTILWPSLLSIIYSGLALISLFIFADHATRVELKKRFHI